MKFGHLGHDLRDLGCNVLLLDHADLQGLLEHALLFCAHALLDVSFWGLDLSLGSATRLRLRPVHTRLSQIKGRRDISKELGTGGIQLPFGGGGALGVDQFTERLFE